MQLFDLAKLFKFEPELAPHQKMIINHYDISTVGTRVHHPISGFRQEAGVIAEPFMTLKDGRILKFPDLPENHEAMATLGKFYQANQLILQIQQEVESEEDMTTREKAAFRRAAKFISKFQNTYQ